MHVLNGQAEKGDLSYPAFSGPFFLLVTKLRVSFYNLEK
jgi:hypothetical protein